MAELERKTVKGGPLGDSLAVVGPAGAVAFRWRPTDSGGPGFGVITLHSRTPAFGMDPMDADCDWFDSPCWSDLSYMHGDQLLADARRNDGSVNPEIVWAELEIWYRERVENGER